MAAGSAPEDPVTFRLGINSGRQMSKFLLKMSALLFNESCTLGVACGVFAPGFFGRRSPRTRHTRAPKRPFYAPARLATFMKMRAREVKAAATQRRAPRGLRSPPACSQPAWCHFSLARAAQRCCFSLRGRRFCSMPIFLSHPLANGWFSYICA